MQAYRLILNNVQKHIKLEAAEQKEFCALLESKEFVAKQFLLKENQFFRRLELLF